MVYPQRATVCVSSQVGCSVGCAFCASGAHGLVRGLSAEEMVDQVLHFARELRDVGRKVTNVVFMGMGEPFLNYDETMRACRLLNDPEGFGLGARGVSISTAGVVPALRRFTAEESQINLAVSLHAATDALRDRLVPLNRRYPLDMLLSACADYVARRRRKLFFEYVVLAGVNDGDDQVRALAERLAAAALPPEPDRLQRDRRRVRAPRGARARRPPRPADGRRRGVHGEALAGGRDRSRLRAARRRPDVRQGRVTIRRRWELGGTEGDAETRRR